MLSPQFSIESNPLRASLSFFYLFPSGLFWAFLLSHSFSLCLYSLSSVCVSFKKLTLFLWICVSRSKECHNALSLSLCASRSRKPRMLHFRVFLCVSLDAIACTLCAFLKKWCWCHFAYALCAFLGRWNPPLLMLCVHTSAMCTSPRKKVTLTPPSLTFSGWLFVCVCASSLVDICLWMPGMPSLEHVDISLLTFLPWQSPSPTLLHCKLMVLQVSSWLTELPL
jgi:hypothetical protein